ncbi:MAG TPA: hypothetical protein VHI13_10830 [Candidatus Kapabacteria bacterium]|nr:hypothetical protein [Candidatus Kapabacteria bacterium]
MENATADAGSELDPIPNSDSDSLSAPGADPEDDTCNEDDGCGACGGSDHNETADEDLPAAEGGVA